MKIEKVRRKDSKGQEIVKGKKMHSLVFVDEISKKQLLDIIEVESYKEFNHISTEEEFSSGSGFNCKVY